MRKASANSKLMGRDAEERFKLADEVKGRDSHFTGYFSERTCVFAKFREHATCTAQTLKFILIHRLLSGGFILADERQECQRLCRAYGAWDSNRLDDPALTHWANL